MIGPVVVEFDVVLPPVRLPTLNLRLHPLERHRVTKSLRVVTRVTSQLARSKARLAPADGPRGLEVVLFRTGRQRVLDQDNLFSGLKPVVDGIRDAGLILDDTPASLPYYFASQQRGGPRERPRVHVTVYDCDPTQTARVHNAPTQEVHP